MQGVMDQEGENQRHNVTQRSGHAGERVTVNGLGCVLRLPPMTGREQDPVLNEALREIGYEQLLRAPGPQREDLALWQAEYERLSPLTAGPRADAQAVLVVASQAQLLRSRRELVCSLVLVNLDDRVCLAWDLMLEGGPVAPWCADATTADRAWQRLLDEGGGPSAPLRRHLMQVNRAGFAGGSNR